MIRAADFAVVALLVAVTAGCESSSRVDVRIPAGTTIEFTLESTLHSGTTKAGERFEGRIHRSLAADGLVAIPFGAKVRGSVKKSESSGSPSGTACLVLTVKEFERDGDFYDVKTEPVELVARPPEPRPELAAAVVGPAIDGGLESPMNDAATDADNDEVPGAETEGVIDATAGPVVVAATAADEIALQRGQVIAVRTAEPVEVAVEG